MGIRGCMHMYRDVKGYSTSMENDMAKNKPKLGVEDLSVDIGQMEENMEATL